MQSAFFYLTLYPVMNVALPFQINILELIFKGILIGVLASAPMGPVGILCINRTLKVVGLALLQELVRHLAI